MGLDGISFAPTLLGQPDQIAHDHLYWEFHEGGFAQAVRFGDWKALRRGPAEPIELYDLSTDAGEARNVAPEHSDLIQKAGRLFRTSRTESPHVKLNPKTSPGSGYARFE